MGRGEEAGRGSPIRLTIKLEYNTHSSVYSSPKNLSFCGKCWNAHFPVFRTLKGKLTSSEKVAAINKKSFAPKPALDCEKTLQKLNAETCREGSKETPRGRTKPPPLFSIKKARYKKGIAAANLPLIPRWDFSLLRSLIQDLLCRIR